MYLITLLHVCVCIYDISSLLWFLSVCLCVITWQKIDQSGGLEAFL